MAKNTYGTGCFMLMHTGANAITSPTTWLPRLDGPVGMAALPTRLTCWKAAYSWLAPIVQWLRDGLGIIRNSSEVKRLLRRCQTRTAWFFVPAFAGLGAPHWDAYARGTIVGMTRGTNKGHIARAALASIAYQTVDILAAMQNDSRIQLQELRVDGGASKNDLLMQFQADVLGVPVVRPVVTETTALGAAYLAGIAVGFWNSQEEVAAQWRMERRFEPNMGADERTQRLKQWHRAVERSRAWVE